MASLYPNYLETQAWQVQAIEIAIEKADNSKAKFADHEKVAVWLKSWGTKNLVIFYNTLRAIL